MESLLGERAAELMRPKLPRISKLEYFFSKKVGAALTAYKMMEENDKILVGVSGGKDILSLLKVLRYKQKNLALRFDIIGRHKSAVLDYID